MSDAQGINGEGIQMGLGDVDFKIIMEKIKSNQTFIVETWQGHKNDGMGFAHDLIHLSELLTNNKS